MRTKTVPKKSVIIAPLDGTGMDWLSGVQDISWSPPQPETGSLLSLQMPALMMIVGFLQIPQKGGFSARIIQENRGSKILLWRFTGCTVTS